MPILAVEHYLEAVWLRVGDRTATPSTADDPSFDDEAPPDDLADDPEGA